MSLLSRSRHPRRLFLLSYLCHLSLRRPQANKPFQLLLHPRISCHQRLSLRFLKPTACFKLHLQVRMMVESNCNVCVPVLSQLLDSNLSRLKWLVWEMLESRLKVISGGCETATSAKSVPKPVIELDLSSPQDNIAGSPIVLKQVRHFSGCSSHSIIKWE